MQHRIYGLPKFARIRLVRSYEVRVVQSLGSQDGCMVCICSSAENLKISGGFTSFPLVFKTTASRFESLESRGEPWVRY